MTETVTCSCGAPVESARDACRYCGTEYSAQRVVVKTPNKWPSQKPVVRGRGYIGFG